MPEHELIFLQKQLADLQARMDGLDLKVDKLTSLVDNLEEIRSIRVLLESTLRRIKE